MVQAITSGSVPLSIEAITDSYSIFSYLAAAHLKLPAEKGTYYHLAFLRERLVSHLIRSYTWVDTRDMPADGLTKGKSDRSALIQIMQGNYGLAHTAHEYCEPTATNSVGYSSRGVNVGSESSALSAYHDTCTAGSSTSIQYSRSENRLLCGGGGSSAPSATVSAADGDGCTWSSLHHKPGM